jgi:geranylgeranyl diphosphate synthase type I
LRSLSPTEVPWIDAAPSPEPAPRTADPLESVKALMLQLATGERFERLGAIVQEHLLTGGKMLRARLAMMATEGLGGRAEDGVAWGAACELLHNATLIHDDLQDGDEVRRGKFSVWVRHGQGQAINAGDLLLMLPYVALEHVPTDGATRWELTRAIASRAEATVRGQSLEMTLLSTGRWDWDSYSAAAGGKTSALFCLPVQGAALIAGRSPAAAAEFGDAFQRLGLLFQMQDDVVDLFGDKGRERGGDIREGRVSALVVEHASRHPSERRWLGQLLGRPRDETTDAHVREVADRFRRGGALEGVLQRIAEVRDALAHDPRLASEPALRAVTAELTERCLRPLATVPGAEEALR